MVIRALRLSKRLTQEQLANEIGVSRSAVAMWENGESYPTTDKLIKLAAVFKCTVDEILMANTKDTSNTKDT